MMSSKIPKSCLDDIQRIQRNFIWGDTEHKRRFHAIGWDKVTVPKSLGGLGVRKLDIMNQACLLKLNWKLQEDNNEYWCTVLRGKYGERRMCGNAEAKGSNSALWKALVVLKPMMDKFSFWWIGDGRTVDAWRHALIEEGFCIIDYVDIPQHLHGMKVYQLVDNSGQWNWTILKDWFPLYMQQKMAAILPPSLDHGSDERVAVGGSKSDHGSDFGSKLSLLEGARWSEFWAMACYSLWTWRNKELHEVNFACPSMPVQHVWRMVGDYEQAVCNGRIVMERAREVTMVRWIPLKEDFMKVNTDGKLCSSVGGSLAKEIRRLVALEWDVEVTHIYREANKCANALANEGCNMDFETRLYESCPDHIRELFVADSMGITTPRLIPL
ncbi:putative ribonuclease H protein [Trifolium medium]|uniref:Putative ribonuclease H protein n=1 Tax=Trifolium medium TaxID=97028 RepID=A0A392M5G4_9FABA|nr:putative ribonuclease H protein [Trifolium medium]